MWTLSTLRVMLILTNVGSANILSRVVSSGVLGA